MVRNKEETILEDSESKKGVTERYEESVYIREREPYTKSELLNLFSEIDSNQFRSIH